MAWIAFGQRTEHLCDAHITVIRDPPGCWIADEDVRGVWSVKQPVFTLDKRCTDLLRHSVEVVHPRETRDPLQLILEPLVVDRRVGELLPTARVYQGAV